MSALPPKAEMAQDDCHKRTWDVVLAASFCVVGFVRTSALLPKAEALAADARRPHITNFPPYKGVPNGLAPDQNARKERPG
jgi:hypothetical protein